MVFWLYGDKITLQNCISSYLKVTAEMSEAIPQILNVSVLEQYQPATIMMMSPKIM